MIKSKPPMLKLSFPSLPFLLTPITNSLPGFCGDLREGSLPYEDLGGQHADPFFKFISLSVAGPSPLEKK